MGGGSFALPLLRTEPALRAAPVFRSAYFPKKLFSFFSKTLDLQPLCGLRWAGEASLSPFCAPKCPFRTFRCFAWLIQLRQRTALSPLKRSCFRFAALTLRCRAEPALRAAPAFRSAYFPKKLFSFFSKTLNLQPLCGLRWAGEASLPPAPLSPAPAVLIFPLCKRRRICFQADRQDAAVPERSSFLCQDSLPVISRQPALRRLTFPAARPAPQSGRRRRRCRSKA